MTIKIGAVDVQKMKFSHKMKSRRAGQENVYISLDGNQSLQFPWMRHKFDTFGAGAFGSKGLGTNMMLSFDGKDESHQEAMAKVREMESRVVQASLEGRWAGVGSSMGLVSAVKVKDDKYFNMRFRLVKDKDSQEFVTACENGNLKEHLVPGCEVQVIARPSRAYITREGTGGVIWEVMTLRVRKGVRTVHPIEWVDDEEAEAAEAQ